MHSFASLYATPSALPVFYIVETLDHLPRGKVTRMRPLPEALESINGIAVDAAGAIYIADTDHHVIRKITPDGVINTIAGTGTAGDSGDGGPAIAAQLNGPTNLALDSAGNLYIADTNNSRVRKVRTDGTTVMFAGNGKVGESGDGSPAIAAQMANPTGIAVDNAGVVYISDAASGLVRTVTADGVIHTIAGAGADPSNAGFAGDGGAALSAQFNGVGSLAVDSTGKVYLLDQGNERVRVLSPMAH
jgi:sugar lactone lactonase YvrE